MSEEANKNNPELSISVTYSDRIDKYINDNSELSRTDAKKLILQKVVFVNQLQVRKANFILKPGTTINIFQLLDKEINIDPEKMEINVVYEDEDIIVIDKKSGVVVHPAPGHKSKTLVNGLLYHFKHLSNIGGAIRPGIVHRIDKDTSGLMVVAKNNFAHQKLAEGFKERKIKRIYFALIVGHLDNEVTHVNLPLGRDPKHRQKMSVRARDGKKAITHLFVVKNYANHSLLRCELETGRTHQIRVHLSYLKHPIFGDPLYGTKVDGYGQRLHAAELFLTHPRSKKKLQFKSPLPPEFLIVDR